eukprot:3023-Heterococcus_DN1.PRE.3
MMCSRNSRCWRERAAVDRSSHTSSHCDSEILCLDAKEPARLCKRTATKAHFATDVSRARPISGGQAVFDQQMQGEFGSQGLTVANNQLKKTLERR